MQSRIATLRRGQSDVILSPLLLLLLLLRVRPTIARAARPLAGFSCRSALANDTRA